MSFIFTLSGILDHLLQFLLASPMVIHVMGIAYMSSYINDDRVLLFHAELSLRLIVVTFAVRMG